MPGPSLGGGGPGWAATGPTRRTRTATRGRSLQRRGSAARLGLSECRRTPSCPSGVLPAEGRAGPWGSVPDSLCCGTATGIEASRLGVARAPLEINPPFHGGVLLWDSHAFPMDRAQCGPRLRPGSTRTAARRARTAVTFCSTSRRSTPRTALEPPRKGLRWSPGTGSNELPIFATVAWRRKGRCGGDPLPPTTSRPLRGGAT
jgi:hypothetical protein